MSYIADTTNLLLGLILYMLNMKISGNPRGYESDEYIKYISKGIKLIVCFIMVTEIFIIKVSFNIM